MERVRDREQPGASKNQDWLKALSLVVERAKGSIRCILVILPLLQLISLLSTHPDFQT